MGKGSGLLNVKLDGVAPLVTDFVCVHSTPLQNPPIGQPPILYSLTSEPIMQVTVFWIFEDNNGENSLSKFEIHSLNCF